MSLRNQPYFPFYVNDYLTDEKLSCCSFATQGVYVKIMCILHKSETYGGILFKQIPKQNFSSIKFFEYILSKQTGIEKHIIADALEELLFFKVLMIEKRNNVDFLFQKRMEKDFNISLKRSEAAKKGGGNPKLAKTNKETDAKNLFKQKPKQNTENEYVYNNDYIDVSNSSNIDSSKKEKNQKKFIPPTLEDFTNYFTENGFSKALAERAWKGYDTANWKDSHDKQIKNWKQKCQHVWFTEKNSPYRIQNAQQPVDKIQNVIDVNNLAKQMVGFSDEGSGND